MAAVPLFRDTNMAPVTSHSIDFGSTYPTDKSDFNVL